MMRLTVRSGKDGRFLARIIEHGTGAPFVLDFGDKRIIEDAQQRLLHGFTMWRFGQLVQAVPQDPEMMRLLAEFYCGEGLLVALEEPTWSGRDQTLDERIPVPAVDLELMGSGWPGGSPAAPAPAPEPLQTLGADLGEADEPTDLADPEDVARALGDLSTTDETTDLADLEDMTDLGPYLVDETDPAQKRPRGLRETVRLPLRKPPFEDPADEIEDQATEILEKKA
jgi:hypothetical protein